MKKLFLTAAILLGLAIGSSAQGFQHNGGILQRCPISDEQTRGDDVGLFLPGHNFTTNWDSNEQGYDESPLGSGALLLVGFGAAYALSRRKKEE